jgi:hypothetical protein
VIAEGPSTSARSRAEVTSNANFHRRGAMTRDAKILFRLSGLHCCDAAACVAVDRGLWQERASTTVTTERDVYF